MDDRSPSVPGNPGTKSKRPAATARAMFISFDGIDGCGKTTQAALFAEWLRQMGREVVSCRDPGGTPLGEALRELLLKKDGLPICRRAEMLLYMASRAQLVEQVIRPALDTGKSVVCDRFLLANIVYQGYAGGLDIDQLWAVGRYATSGLRPDLVFLLDIATDAAAQRLQRGLDRMEMQGEAYRRRLREGYLKEAARDPRIVVIDAERTVDVVRDEIRRLADERLDISGAR